MVLTSPDPKYFRQIEQLKELQEEMYNVQKLKHPSGIKAELDNIQNKLSILTEKIEKVEKIQTQLLKSNTKILQDLVSDGMEGVRQDLKEEVRKNQIDLELELMKLDLDFYKPDLNHLHRRNLEEANNISEN